MCSGKHIFLLTHTHTHKQGKLIARLAHRNTAVCSLFALQIFPYSDKTHARNRKTHNANAPLMKTTMMRGGAVFRSKVVRAAKCTLTNAHEEETKKNTKFTRSQRNFDCARLQMLDARDFPHTKDAHALARSPASHCTLLPDSTTCGRRLKTVRARTWPGHGPGAMLLRSRL